jgi:hypothetical protein
MSKRFRVTLPEGSPVLYVVLSTLLGTGTFNQGSEYDVEITDLKEFERLKQNKDIVELK